MASRFQAAALVASPSYPNSIVWSDENLVAVASGHLVTILNPAAMPFGPRGLITVCRSEPYPFGAVKREDLLSGCLLPTCLSRDPRLCVRSISWSHIGMAPNSGCLLAVCTTDGHVKLYRPPFCDFCAEWIEVMDITDRHFDYLASISFGELDIPSLEISNMPERNHGCSDESPNYFSIKKQKQESVNATGVISGKDVSTGLSPSSSRLEGQGAREVLMTKSDEQIEKRSRKAASASKSKGRSAKKIPENCSLPSITPYQYASFSAMLSSLVVAWSPLLKVASKTCLVPENNSSNGFSLLAVGAKSGIISLWRIHAPRCYSIEQSEVPNSVELVGLLQAHNSWITTMDWASVTTESSNPEVLLATGSSDGSVKIWLGYAQEFLESSEVHNVPFFLLKEVININAVPVPVLSLLLPAQSLDRILLAVGKGSGTFEVWIGNVSSRKFDKAGSYDAHDQAVTGLAWAFDGCCLYSCSQDNFVHSWILRGSSLSEVPIPSSTPTLRSFSDLPEVFVSCLGVAVSPGNSAVAMVRNFDVDQLNPMYEGRSQKAAVEFFWIGGQQRDTFLDNSSEFAVEAFPYFSENDSVYWVSNILWSLKQYEHIDKPLVVWDIIAALLAFKQSSPEYFNYILVKWLSGWLGGSDTDLTIEKVVPHVSKGFSKVASRLLHLLNIICRRLMLAELNADEININLQNIGGLDSAENKQLALWMELLSSSERELRERLVGLTFAAFIFASNSGTGSSQPGYWHPVGLAQMEDWVEHNRCIVSDQLMALAAEVKNCKRASCTKHVAEEQCSYCLASVPFDSPEFAFCKGSKSSGGDGQKHKLARCAVSMQVCPTNPLWLCKCCHRWAFKLAPETLFRMPRYSLDLKLSPESGALKEVSKPLCPFCGILLQRSQPEFLLSAWPV